MNIINLLFKKIPNTNIIFLRVMTCLIAIILIIALWDDIVNIYGSKGYINHEIIEVTEYEFEPRLEWLTTPIEKYLNISEIEAIKICLLICIIILFLTGIGFYPQLCAFISAILWLMILNSSKPFQYGLDYFILSALFYCCVFPSQGFFNPFSNKNIYYIYTWVLKVHLSIVYFFGGLAKSLGETWWNGEAIWRAVNMGENPSTINLIAEYPYLSIITTLLVLFCELLHPFLMILYPFRVFTLLILLGMHLFIAIFMELYFFSAMMIILNIAAYWHTFYDIKKQILSYSTDFTQVTLKGDKKNSFIV